jgi:hypothetical protein
MAKNIILRYSTRCSDCQTVLAVGDEARWYGRGIVYGLVCHDRSNVKSDTTIHRTGRCEDAPCCGCCSV